MHPTPAPGVAALSAPAPQAPALPSPSSPVAASPVAASPVAASPVAASPVATSPAPALAAAAARPVPGALLERVLREGPALTVELLTAPDVGRHVPGLAAVAAGGAAIFGLALGLQGGAVQALVSTVKLPLIVLGAAGISLPVLHVSSALAGHPLAPARLSALVLQAVATATVTMAGLVPLAVITWLTYAAGAGPDSPELWVAYRRLILATVAVGVLGGLAGAARLRRAVPTAALLPWSVALGLAGLQLTWLLRPVVGMPGRTVLLRPLESNALTEVLVALGAVLGG